MGNPESFMLDSQGYLKLCDFGLAKQLDSSMRTFSVVGTAFYMAPEVIKGHGHGLEADIWSLGVMFYEMVCGCFPFGNDARDQTEIFEHILEKQNNPVAFHKPGGYDCDDAKILIQAMLQSNPWNRIGTSIQGWKC